MGKYKTVILEGARKGESCMFPAGENIYCGRHQQYREVPKLRPLPLGSVLTFARYFQHSSLRY